MATLQQNLEAFADTVGDKVKAIRVLVNNNATDLSALNTTAKANVVVAINELKTRLDAIPVVDDNSTSLTKLWSSSKIHNEILEALNGVLANAPSALDTLEELANAINDDENFAASVTAMIDRRVRWDVASQNLSDSQKNNARVNIGAASLDDVGATDVNYVTLFNTGLL